jgi:histidyl-tRNA synthetase
MKGSSVYSQGLVIYDEQDLIIRRYIVENITSRLKEMFNKLNPAIRMFQVETPTLTPHALLQSHIDTNFDLVEAGDFCLRPETTRGTYEAIKSMYPQQEQLRKALPLCVWQFGKSYRNEQKRPFSELRFKEFYQLEYQLIYSMDTKADYHAYMSDGMTDVLGFILNKRISIDTVKDLPHYSEKTTDLYYDKHELVAISSRKDFSPHKVLEISCGLDRICAAMDL